MTRKRTFLFTVVGLVAVAAGLVVALRHFAVSSETVGAPAAPFLAATFDDLDGRPEPMARWQGQLVVVNFWATWCPPCVEEMPDLQHIHDQYSARGVSVVGLGIDSPAALRKFRDQHGLTLPLYAAGAAGSELVRALGNPSGALPYTVLVNSEGRIVQAKLGQIRPAQLRAWLDAQLGERPG